MNRLAGRVAVITGASSGIGEATAEAFSRAGMAVVLGARRAERLEEVVGRLRAAGGQARGLPTDVSDPAAVRRLVDAAVEGFGRLDVLVNNAGLGYFAAVESTPLEEARQLFEVNFFGTLHG
ncbi:MAG: SDR family oxidoreductase, partial [Candidatus Methylomirabilales bacterium]